MKKLSLFAFPPGSQDNHHVGVSEELSIDLY